MKREEDVNIVLQHVTAKKGTSKPDLVVSLYLNILYNLVLFNQNDPAFASEIGMHLHSPPPTFLFFSSSFLFLCLGGFVF